MSPECTFTTSWITVADSLVELCTNTNFDSDPDGDPTPDGPTSVFVTPWDGDGHRQEIEVELGPPAPDGGYDLPRLLAVPSALVAFEGGATRVVGLR